MKIVECDGGINGVVLTKDNLAKRLWKCNLKCKVLASVIQMSQYNTFSFIVISLILSGDRYKLLLILVHLFQFLICLGIG
jgi:hypothetical protein